MEYETILCDVEGPVAYLTLHRPEKLNAINEQLRSDLEAALRDLDQGDDVRVVVLKAAGRAFCAGYDLTPRPGGGGGRASIAQDRDRLRKIGDPEAREKEEEEYARERRRIEEQRDARIEKARRS